MLALGNFCVVHQVFDDVTARVLVAFEKEPFENDHHLFDVVNRDGSSGDYSSLYMDFIGSVVVKESKMDGVLLVEEAVNTKGNEHEDLPC